MANLLRSPTLLFAKCSSSEGWQFKEKALTAWEAQTLRHCFNSFTESAISS